MSSRQLTGGIGANTALRDAALLNRALTATAHSAAELNATIATYEEATRAYGFEAVRRSFAGATQLYRIELPESEKDV